MTFEEAVRFLLKTEDIPMPEELKLLGSQIGENNNIDMMLSFICSEKMGPFLDEHKNFSPCTHFFLLLASLAGSAYLQGVTLGYLMYAEHGFVPPPPEPKPGDLKLQCNPRGKKYPRSVQ